MKNGCPLHFDKKMAMSISFPKFMTRGKVNINGSALLIILFYFNKKIIPLPLSLSFGVQI